MLLINAQRIKPELLELNPSIYPPEVVSAFHEARVEYEKALSKKAEEPKPEVIAKEAEKKKGFNKTLVYIAVGAVIAGVAAYLLLHKKKPSAPTTSPPPSPPPPPPPPPPLLEFVRLWGDGLNNPIDIEVDDQGYVLVADYKNHLLKKFTPDGGLLFEIPRANARCIAIDRRGFIYVDYYRGYCSEGIFGLYVFSPSGEFADDIRLEVTGCTHIFVGECELKGLEIFNENIYYTQDYADRYNVRLTDLRGNFIKKFGGSDVLSSPYDIAIDSAGYVYVVDANDFIAKFSSNGDFITKIGSHGSGDGQFSNPRGIAVDDSGNIWVADTNNHRIQKLSPSGQFIGKHGSYGSGPGQFNHPEGLAISKDGFLYVSDTFNHRIQKFRIK